MLHRTWFTAYSENIRQIQFTFCKVWKLQYPVQSQYQCDFPFSVYARDAGQFHLLGSSMWVEASSSLMLFSKLFSRLFNFYALRGVLYSLPWYWYSNLKETAIHMLVGRNIYTINWSTQLMTGLFVQGKGYLQSPLCWDSQGFCFVLFF